MNRASTLRSTERSWEYVPAFAREQLPRYTSYPPANHFNHVVNGDTARAALAMLPCNASLSLYVHIPYCKKLCWYCGCHTSVPTAADPLNAYVDALKAEIVDVAGATPAHATVTRLHFGGGSPDILSPVHLRDILATLRASFAFADRVEIAAELDPRGLTTEVVDAYAAAGLTRASLGVQVLDSGVQERINRIQPRPRVEAAVRDLRAAGVGSLNMDMMYGLPGQTTDHVTETATFASTHDIDRIAVFGYAHVPWMKKHQKGIHPENLPEGEVRFRQAEAAARALEAAGYLPIGFDHFAAPGDALAAAEMQGRLHRNFQGYTDDDSTALIAFGASAISSLPNLIYQNTPDTTAYRKLVADRRSPVVRGIALSAEHRRVAALLERLLCYYEAVVPADLLAKGRSRLDPAIAAGLAELRGATVTVTARGRPYVRNVAACFDPSFVPQDGKHSLAV
jgi:oxygen-independent coproporphyrinogen III oxidase